MGIPLTGLDSTGKMPERTATEILRQQISKESNTANYYNNAFRACRAIAKILIQFVSGQDLKFTLENGPSDVCSSDLDQTGASGTINDHA